MKLATIRVQGATRPGVLLSNGNFVDLAAAAEHRLLVGGPVHTIVDLLDDRAPQAANVRRLVDQIEAGSDSIQERLQKASALIPEGEAKLAPPVLPRTLISAGNAYREHIAEMKVPPPTEPRGFLKAFQSYSGPFDPIILPQRDPDMVDWECEFSCVFGRPCANVDAAEALDYVAGYTMINDVSARSSAADFIRTLGEGSAMANGAFAEKNIFGKQHPTFCPIGPVITTKDEIPDVDNVNIGTRLNGEVMQSANTSDWVFSLGELIAYFSKWFHFQPGDILTTGSPSGVGFARNPQIFMKPGDVVEVFGEGIGSLRNPVVAATES